MLHSRGEILCIHGGIGDSIASLDDLRGIPKPIQVAGEINERRDPFACCAIVYTTLLHYHIWYMYYTVL